MKANSFHEFFAWFQNLSGAERVEAISQLLPLLNYCELRFAGSCIEDTAKKDHSHFWQNEYRANSSAFLTQLTDLMDRGTRCNLILSISLMYSYNSAAASVVYRCLASVERLLEHMPCTHEFCEEMILLFTLACNHPAFSFSQQTFLRGLKQKFRERLSQSMVVGVGASTFSSSSLIPCAVPVNEPCLVDRGCQTSRTTNTVLFCAKCHRHRNRDRVSSVNCLFGVEDRSETPQDDACASEVLISNITVEDILNTNDGSFEFIFEVTWGDDIKIVHRTLEELSALHKKILKASLEACCRNDKRLSASFKSLVDNLEPQQLNLEAAVELADNYIKNLLKLPLCLLEHTWIKAFFRPKTLLVSTEPSRCEVAEIRRPQSGLELESSVSLKSDVDSGELPVVSSEPESESAVERKLFIETGQLTDVSLDNNQVADTLLTTVDESGAATTSVSDGKVISPVPFDLVEEVSLSMDQDLTTALIEYLSHHGVAAHRKIVQGYTRLQLQEMTQDKLVSDGIPPELARQLMKLLNFIKEKLLPRSNGLITYSPHNTSDSKDMTTSVSASASPEMLLANAEPVFNIACSSLPAPSPPLQNPESDNAVTTVATVVQTNTIIGDATTVGEIERPSILDKLFVDSSGSVDETTKFAVPFEKTTSTSMSSEEFVATSPVPMPGVSKDSDSLIQPCVKEIETEQNRPSSVPLTLYSSPEHQKAPEFDEPIVDQRLLFKVPLQLPWQQQLQLASLPVNQNRPSEQQPSGRKVVNTSRLQQPAFDSEADNCLSFMPQEVNWMKNNSAVDFVNHGSGPSTSYLRGNALQQLQSVNGGNSSYSYSTGPLRGGGGAARRPQRGTAAQPAGDIVSAANAYKRGSTANQSSLDFGVPTHLLPMVSNSGQQLNGMATGLSLLTNSNPLAHTSPAFIRVPYPSAVCTCNNCALCINAGAAAAAYNQPLQVQRAAHVLYNTNGPQFAAQYYTGSAGAPLSIGISQQSGAALPLLPGTLLTSSMNVCTAPHLNGPVEFYTPNLSVPPPPIAQCTFPESVLELMNAKSLNNASPNEQVSGQPEQATTPCVCCNCGQSGHAINTCPKPTMDDILQKNQFKLNFMSDVKEGNFNELS